MRSVFVFPAGDPARTAAVLDAHLPGQRDPWLYAGACYVRIATTDLFADWEPDDVAVLDTAVGHRPAWAVTIDVSGRIDGGREVRHLVALLLRHGGVAVDDHSAHPWTLEQIQAGATAGGRHFFGGATA